MAAEPDDAAALLLPLLLLGASDRADDDADATQPMAILFPRPRRGRPSWTSNDGNGRRLNEEGKEAGARTTRGLCAAAVLQLQPQQVWVLLLGDGLMSRAMARRCLYRLARGTVRRGLRALSFACALVLDGLMACGCHSSWGGRGYIAASISRRRDGWISICLKRVLSARCRKLVGKRLWYQSI